MRDDIKRPEQDADVVTDEADPGPGAMLENAEVAGPSPGNETVVDPKSAGQCDDRRDERRSGEKREASRLERLPVPNVLERECQSRHRRRNDE